METAMVGAGCFWGAVSFFREVPGVADAVVGYAGGKVENPTDPAKVNFFRLLDVFFANPGPTRLNRPGPDHGSQYHQRYFEKNGLHSCHVNLPES